MYPFFGETFEAPPNGIRLECRIQRRVPFDLLVVLMGPQAGSLGSLGGCAAGIVDKCLRHPRAQVGKTIGFNRDIYIYISPRNCG